MTEAEIATLVRALLVSRHAALHDPLTGLANRSLILDHLELALARAGRGTTLAAVVFFDLDGFKQINDTLGHRAGDEVLVLVAERLGPALRPADTLGRWGGDEFIVVCEDVERVSDAAAIVGRIAAAFELPFTVAGTEIDVAASIGVAVSAGTDEPGALIAAADSAMYRAKRDRPGRKGKGPNQPARAAVVELPQHERLTRRLQEVLTLLEVDDPLAAQKGAGGPGLLVV
jgi:diguanylate cyclase (GGDEF)-like protein